MTLLDVTASTLVLTAVLAWLNGRYIGLPSTIGVMGASLLLSFVLLGLDSLSISFPHDYEKALTDSIDFSEVVMQGMLSILLFAGALHVDLGELRAYRWPVGLLALFGTGATMLLVGYGLWRNKTVQARAAGGMIPAGRCP